MKVRLEVELEYCDTSMHGGDPDATAWFWEDVLLHPQDGAGLTLFSEEIGDEVGRIRVLRVLEGRKCVTCAKEDTPSACFGICHNENGYPCWAPKEEK